MQTILFVIGGLVSVGALAGFFISFWRSAPRVDESARSESLAGSGSYTEQGQGDG